MEISVYTIFSYAIMTAVMLQAFYTIGFSEQVEIDLMARLVTSQKKVFGISYKTSSVNWPSGYKFKNSIEYDSYRNITAVWLVAFSESQESRKLFRFFDKKTFLVFQNIFNENFPDHKILEWHE